jgi:hypothetical protein
LSLDEVALNQQKLGTTVFERQSESGTTSELFGEEYYLGPISEADEATAAFGDVSPDPRSYELPLG